MRTFLVPVVAGALSLILLACGGGEPSPTPTPDPTSNATTQTAEPEPTATSQPAPTDTPLPDIGLVDQKVSAPAIPDSPFDADAGPAVIYDTVNGETIDLGQGSLGTFSPDSSRYAWIAGDASAAFGTVTVLALESGTATAFGEGRSPVWLDDERLAYWVGATNTLEVVDIATGATSDFSAVEYEAAIQRTFLSPDPFGYEIAPDHRDPDSECFAPALECHYVILVEGDIAILDFVNFRVLPVDEDTVLVANVPEDGVTDLYYVNLDTGQGRPIGSTTIAEFNFPLVATPDFVAWVDDFCGFEQGNLYIHHRDTGATTEVDNGDDRWGYLETTPGGLLGIGDFGPFLLINPATLEVEVALPGAAAASEHGSGGSTSWSPDYRYAARGFVGGHGGLCAG